MVKLYLLNLCDRYVFFSKILPVVEAKSKWFKAISNNFLDKSAWPAIDREMLYEMEGDSCWAISSLARSSTSLAEFEVMEITLTSNWAMLVKEFDPAAAELTSLNSFCSKTENSSVNDKISSVWVKHTIRPRLIMTSFVHVDWRFLVQMDQVVIGAT